MNKPMAAQSPIASSVFVLIFGLVIVFSFVVPIAAKADVFRAHWSRMNARGGRSVGVREPGLRAGIARCEILNG